MDIKTGTYTGDGGTSRGITGVGFAPIAVFVMNEQALRHELATDQMASGHSWSFNGDDRTDGITSLDADGFTLGDGATVQDSLNKNTEPFWYLAFGSGGGTDIATGSYTGDNQDDRSITGSGFNPDMVLVNPTHTSFETCYRTSGYPAGESSHVLANGFQTDQIQAFVTDGFQIGTSNEVNYNGSTYYYVTWLSDDAYADHGGYTGNGNDDRNITTLFDPTFVVTDGDDAGVYNHFNHTDIGGEPSYWWLSGQLKNDCIQALSTGGGNYFQVGTHDYVNKNTVAFEYFVFKDGTTAGGAGITVTPAVMDLAASLPVAAITGGATIAPSVLNLLGSLPGATVITGAVVSVDPATAALTVLGVVVRTGEVVPPLHLAEMQRQSLHLVDLRRQGVTVQELERVNLRATLD